MKIKPCPFCGSNAFLKASYSEVDGEFKRARCGCPQCNIFILGEDRDWTNGIPCGFATREEYEHSNMTAIEKWNRRV